LAPGSRLSSGRPTTQLVLVGLVALVVACATHAAPARGAVPRVVVDLAPLVWLHSTERLWPADPGDFVARSALGWNRRAGCRDTIVAARGSISAGRLGTRSLFGLGPYEERPTTPRPPSGSDQCARRPTAVRATAYSRPERPNDEGFFLDHDNREREGVVPRCPPAKPKCGVYDAAPVHYQYSPRRFITYWFFFAFSAPVGEPISAFSGHEGDWERISIRLDAQNEPTAVAYWQHKGEPSDENGRVVSWRRVEHEDAVVGDRPVVFSARGSHASYPKECRKLLGVKTCLTDRRNRGWLWRTAGHLRDVTAEPWYGFGGAWGAVRGLHPDRTGPSGPGPNGLGCHKPAAPRRWLPAGTCG
jgi:hypothetical protein